MIKVTRLDGVAYWLNPHQIESVESKPDTTILMLSGKYVVVKETIDVLLQRIIAYRRQIGGFKNEE